ncbi:MAG: hydrogenase maturation protease [Blastocatellia bacterium]|nr:hydrogenase maturation protease [Blastocatellia bacterium]
MSSVLSPQSSVLSPSRICLIGMGQEFRGDDAVGILLARRLKNRLGTQVQVIEACPDGASLLCYFTEFEVVLIVDAVTSGAPAGTIHILDGRTEAIPNAWFQVSTHTVSLPEAIQLATVLGQLPRRLRIWGIEGAGFDVGSELSLPVAQVMSKVEDLIAAECHTHLKIGLRTED